MNRFTNRTVIVTGGASGIGQAAAKRIFAEGANVVVVDMNGDGARHVAESLDNAERAYAVALDVTDRATVHRMMAEAASRFGHLHALVNCAGIRGVTSVLEAEAEQWARVHAVNLEGTLILSQEFAKLALKAGHPAAIVNLSSLAGVTAVPEPRPLRHFQACRCRPDPRDGDRAGHSWNPCQRHYARHDPHPNDGRHV